MSDLERAFEALNGKQERYQLLWDYYDGKHPLIYTARRLSTIFKKLDAKFEENWCAVVVDAAVERMEFNRFVVPEERLQSRLNTLFRTTEMDLDVYEVHKSALVTGEAFVMVWKDDEGEIEAYHNKSRLCHIQYDAEKPREKAWAAKWWKRTDGCYQMNLYYAEYIEYYQTEKASIEPQKFSEFKLFDEAENPFREIPIFHFQRERRRITSELDNVINMNAAVNKLFSDKMVAAEFGAFRQRYVISNAEIKTLKNAPNEVWDIPAGDGLGQQTTVGEFAATELMNYIEAMKSVIAAIAAISKTPMHYFFKQPSGDAPSGEALIALEAPLNKKCAHYIRNFANTWQRVGAFMLQLEYGEVLDPESIEAVYDEPETVQPRTEAEIIELQVRSGVPLVTALRKAGWSKAEIEQMLKDKAQEQAEESNSLAQALLDKQRRFDQERNDNRDEEDKNDMQGSSTMPTQNRKQDTKSKSIFQNVTRIFTGKGNQ